MSVFASHGVGRYRPAEKDLYLGPRLYKHDNSRIGVVLIHGSGGDSFSWTPTPSNTANWTYAITSYYPTVSCDFGGPNTWGNDTAMSAITDAVTWLKNTWGARLDKVVLIGGSMGNINALNWAYRNPSEVACVIGLLPACDLYDFWFNNRANCQPLINGAYGGIYDENVQGPVRNPIKIAQAGGLNGLPWKAWYATDDTIAIPSTATNLASLIGGTAELVPVTGGHSDTPFAQIVPQDILSFINDHS